MSSPPTLTAKAIYAQLKAAVNDSNAKKDSLSKVIKKLGGKDIFRVRDGLGQTVLHLAAGEGNLGLFAALFEDSKTAGLANLEEKDNNDWRVLHCACNAGSLGVTYFVITHGADINAITIEGASCLHYFPKISPAQDPDMYEQTLNLILTNIKNINQQNKRGQTALHKAALEGTAKRPLLIKKLLALKPSMNSRDSVGETPLHAAARNGDIDLVIALLDNGADINMLGEMGTPKQVAEDSNQKETARAMRKWAKKHGIKIEGGSTNSKASRTRVTNVPAGPGAPASSTRTGLLESSSSQAILRRVLRPSNLNDDSVEGRARLDAVRRHNILTEFTESEANYVKTIKELQESYLEPLQKLASDPEHALLSPIEVKLVFSGELPTILRLHTGVLAALRQRIKTFEADSKISDVFQSIPSHGFCYKNYTSNFDTALDTLKKIILTGSSNKSPQVVATNDVGIPLEPEKFKLLDPQFQPTASKFLDWINARMLRRGHRNSVGQMQMTSSLGTTHSGNAGMITMNSGNPTPSGGLSAFAPGVYLNRMDSLADFLSLLMYPLQRVGQYISLLREYIQCTPSDHADFADLNSLYDQLVRVGESILEVKVLAETRVKIIQITESLSGYTESLFRSDREFLREGTVSFRTTPLPGTVVGKGTPKLAPAPGQLFLFNDLLLWAKKIPADKQNRTLAFVRSVLLKNISAVANADVSEPGNRTAFEVITAGATESIVFYAENEEQRQSWVSAIAAATSRAASHVMWIKVRAKGSYPSPRASHSATVLKNRLFLFGGHYSNTYYNDLYMFTIDKQQWAKLPTMEEGPSRRTEHAAVAVDSQRFFMFGGFNGKTRLNDLWVFDSAEMSWFKIEPDQPNTVPRERSGHKMVRLHGAIYVFGGIDSTGTYLSDMWKLQISGDGRAIWQVVSYDASAKIPEARAFHSMVAIGGLICIHGGYSFKKCFDDLFMFDPKAKTWIVPTEVSPAAAAAQQQIEASEDGSTGSTEDSITSSSNSTSSSSNPLLVDAPAELRPTARSHHACFSFGDTVFIHGGNTYSGSTHLCDMWALRRVGSSGWGTAPVQWTKLPLPLQLDSRYGHTISAPLLYTKSNKSVAVMFGGVSGLLTQYNFWNDVTIFKNLAELLALCGVQMDSAPTSSSSSSRQASSLPAPPAAETTSTSADNSPATKHGRPRAVPSMASMPPRPEAAILAPMRARATSIAVAKTAQGRARALSIVSGNTPVPANLDGSEEVANPDEELTKPSPVVRYAGKGTMPLTMETLLSDPVFIERCVIDCAIHVPPVSAASSSGVTNTEGSVNDPPEVYRAVYGGFEFPKAPSVAVKIYRNLKVTPVMRSEFSVLRVARHPNLVPYYALAERDGDAWLASGSCITNVSQLATTLDHSYSEREVATIAKAVLCALNVLHACDIQAKCVKPENIFVLDNGAVQLGDWGLGDIIAAAREASAQPTSSVASILPSVAASRKGSVATHPIQSGNRGQLYIAPENKKQGGGATSTTNKQQITGYESRADIWAFGITMVCLCEPRQKDYMIPGREDKDMEAMRAIFTKSASKLVQSRMFRDFITHCLAPQPENRSDASSLLKHPFIVQNTVEPDKLAMESADSVACDAPEELATMVPLVQNYQRQRRPRSVDTVALKMRRELMTQLVGEGDEVPMIRSYRPRSNSTGRSLSPGRKDRRIKRSSGAPKDDDSISPGVSRRVRSTSEEDRQASAIQRRDRDSPRTSTSSKAPPAAVPTATASATPTVESGNTGDAESSESVQSKLEQVSSQLADRESEINLLKAQLAAEKARLEAEKAEMARQLRAQIEAEMRAEMLKQSESASSPTLAKKTSPPNLNASGGATRAARSNSKILDKIVLFEQTAAENAEIQRKTSGGSLSSK